MHCRKIFYQLILFCSFVFLVSANETADDPLLNKWIWNCVGNEDNSLFLIHTTNQMHTQEDVYYFFSGQYNTDVAMHKIKNVGSFIGNIVFSPYSRKFYFCSTDGSKPWVNDHGLWIGTQTGIKDEPFIFTRQNMKEGRGYIAVNKCGVWLLHDTENNDGKLYKIEDTQGNFIFNVPQAVQNASFNSFRNFMEPKRPEATVTYEHEQCFRFTDYTLLICDKDETMWWVFDCVKETAERYNGYELALKNATKLDEKYELQLQEKNEKSGDNLPFMILLICCLIITVLLLVVFVVQKIRHNKNQSEIIKERNKMIFDIQEKERAKISRDIHDSVVQDIRVLRLETENLVVDENSKQKQTKIADLATDCIIKLRNICYNLTPAELASHTDGDSSKLELISIINSLVQQFSARTHIPCIFKVAEGFEYPVLEKEKTQNLFRVIQEALTNIEKHSYATQASIFMKKNDDVLLIYVTDDGIGCNQNELDKKIKSEEHIGLRSMKERMELIGGSIEFFTSQSDGMEIKIELPLETV